MTIKSIFRNLNIHSLCFLALLLSACLIGSLAYANEKYNHLINDTSIPHEHVPLYRAALEGSAEAQFELGLLFEYGRDVNQDDSIAADWYEMAAAQQFSNAQYRLAILFDNGWGIEADQKKAFTLYESAAQNGHELAQHDVAIMYFEGAGVNKNPLQAYKWLRIAVLSGSALMQKHLNIVALELSPHEIKVAENLANEWFENFSI